jgi:hypothetical protein
MSWAPEFILGFLKVVVWPLALVTIVWFITRACLKAQPSQSIGAPSASSPNPQPSNPSPPLATGNQESLYNSFVQLAIHEQENKWLALQVFLIFQPLLFIAWAYIYDNKNFSGSGTIFVRLLLPLVPLAMAALSAVVWFFLLRDYENATRIFDEACEAIERGFSDKHRPVTKRHEQKDKKLNEWPSFSLGVKPTFRFLMTAIVGAFGFADAILLVISIATRMGR